MTVLVAEIGMNHDGNFDLAHELIRQAKLAGADIAKFQLGWRHKPDEINHITLERAQRLKAVCAHHEIEFMSSIITDEAFELAKELDFKRYKIASRTVKENPKLVERVLAEGKETFISLGWWDGEGWPFGNPTEKLRYIHCVSQYPTYPSGLKGFPKEFSPDALYGYSDHFLGVSACFLALSRGARFIEKHFTLNKTSQVIRDHTLSATPAEFRLLNEEGRQLQRVAEVVLGRRDPEL